MPKVITSGEIGIVANRALEADHATSADNADKIDDLDSTSFNRVYRGTINGTTLTFDQALTQGEYSFSCVGSTNGSPTFVTSAISIYGKCIVIVNDGGTHNNTSNWIWQIVYTTRNDNVWVRKKVNSSDWTSWHKLLIDNASLTYNVTLDTNWSGTTAPYTKTVTVSGILSTDNPTVDVVMSGTYATDESRVENWSYIYRIVTGTNSITVYALEKPTVSLPIQLKAVR